MDSGHSAPPISDCLYCLCYILYSHHTITKEKKKKLFLFFFPIIKKAERKEEKPQMKPTIYRFCPIKLTHKIQCGCVSWLVHCFHHYLHQHSHAVTAAVEQEDHASSAVSTSRESVAEDSSPFNLCNCLQDECALPFSWDSAPFLPCGLFLRSESHPQMIYTSLDT